MLVRVINRCTKLLNIGNTGLAQHRILIRHMVVIRLLLTETILIHQDISRDRDKVQPQQECHSSNHRALVSLRSKELATPLLSKGLATLVHSKELVTLLSSRLVTGSSRVLVTPVSNNRELGMPVSSSKELHIMDSNRQVTLVSNRQQIIFQELIKVSRLRILFHSVQFREWQEDS